MKITIVGGGYVGLVTGACFAEFGYLVTIVDKDVKKIANLNSGVIPIYEPGLDLLVAQGISSKRLQFTTKFECSDIVMIAVGTPSRHGDGNADLTYVLQATEEIARSITEYTVVVTKSTVPVGTSEKIAQVIKNTRPDLVEGEHFNVASNPEFLREGSAINDFMRPDRVILGTNNDRAKELLQKLYRPLYLLETPIVHTDTKTAELIKYASNGFLALKISFINQMSDLCEKTGANVKDLAKGVGLDKRIGGKFLHVSPGYGGSCFPKDTLALSKISKSLGVPCSLMDTVIFYNDQRKKEMAKRIINILKNHDSLPKRIAILGITFKPNTDDLRESASLVIISELLSQGIEVVVYDPLYRLGSERIPHAISCAQDFARVSWATSSYDAICGSSCVVILTEWNEFRALDLERVELSLNKEKDKKPIFIDFRNIYKPEEMKNFEYHSLGR